MSTSLPTGLGPDALDEAFHVYEVEVADGDVRYYGEPLVERENVVQRLAPQFRERGYRVMLNYETGEYVLVATERSVGVDGVPWTNVALFLATVLTTLFAGSRWYGVDPLADPARLVEAWPFAAAVLGVLAVHEFGHYALSRHHDVAASLPYFIPLPNLLGTLGAVISMNDHIPDRDALFDIGVAGPLAGLVATVVVTAIGVSLPPVEVAQVAGGVTLGYPLLIQGVAALLGEPLVYGEGLSVNPVVVGGWVGAFVTFLNLLPVGQLDGAHVTKALVGDYLGAVQRAVPVALFGLAGYLYLFEGGRSAGVWAVWGFLTLLLGRAGSAEPLDDTPVGTGRKLVGALTLVLGVLCFTPMPVVLG
ncbi:site-2 protease family protein [Salinirubellus salinus]|uniref:Site-2 protease family protein n=1 Tax=Salinirubellus salinus TaxID=1364945 RepID=A0A9E7R2I5_9EURY|nr:site-2 protease family protein [Salinirubellus salinus]UWM54283.1 site-2 protease family protein [Salinirubellus salinus]